MTMDNGNLDNIVLALLFSADEPLSVRKIMAIVEDASAADVKDAIDRWRKKFDDDAWSIVLEKVAGGFQLSSRPEYASFIARLYSGRRKLRLSKAALETLAIISYKQPITRAEIENVRGVGCGSVVGNLMERGLIKITGKAKVLGAPFLYGTTQEFLEYLGLNSLKDLPSAEELEALLEREEQAADITAESTPNGAGETESPTGDAEDTSPAPEGAIELGFATDADFDTDDETEILSDTTDVEVVDEPEEPAEETPIEIAVEETSPAAAVIGPALDEPYHRPVGSDGGTNNPIWTEIATTSTPATPESLDPSSPSDSTEEENGEERRPEDSIDERED
jgi:segregation and condensation protein B